VAEHTHIPWTGYTYCPWWGCSKVAGAPECEHCYAADDASRHLHPRHTAAAEKGNWTGIFTRSSEAVRFERRTGQERAKDFLLKWWGRFDDVHLRNFRKLSKGCRLRARGV
jgi:protein gp37